MLNKKSPILMMKCGFLTGWLYEVLLGVPMVLNPNGIEPTFLKEN